jgi:hypothetical protein
MSDSGSAPQHIFVGAVTIASVPDGYILIRRDLPQEIWGEIIAALTNPESIKKGDPSDPVQTQVFFPTERGKKDTGLYNGICTLLTKRHVLIHSCVCLS